MFSNNIANISLFKVNIKTLKTVRYKVNKDYFTYFTDSSSVSVAALRK